MIIRKVFFFYDNKYMTKIIVNSLWIGPKLTRLEKASIQSYIDTGHEFHLWIYQDVDGIPQDTILKDANIIIPEDQIFKIKDTCASFSDIWRYKMLYDIGGYWVDLDMISLKTLDFKEDYIISSERTIQQGAFKSLLTYVPNIGVLKSPQGSKFYGELYEKCLGSKHNNNNDITKYMKLFRNHIKKYKFEKYIKSPDFFCNLDWWHTKEMFDTKEYKPKYGVAPDENLLGGYSIHMWRHLTKKYKKDLDAKYNLFTMYEILLNKYKL